MFRGWVLFRAWGIFLTIPYIIQFCSSEANLGLSEVEGRGRFTRMASERKLGGRVGPRESIPDGVLDDVVHSEGGLAGSWAGVVGEAV